jgi:hypothetical protein
MTAVCRGRRPERFYHPERAGRAREEIEFLAAELAAATGLGGRDRKAASNAERARVSVTKAIRTTLKRVEEHDRVVATRASGNGPDRHLLRVRAGSPPSRRVARRSGMTTGAQGLPANVGPAGWLITGFDRLGLASDAKRVSPDRQREKQRGTGPPA